MDDFKNFETDNNYEDDMQRVFDEQDKFKYNTSEPDRFISEGYYQTEPTYRKFNWAACFLGLPFAFGTGAYMCLLSLVPAVGWIFSIISGLKGEEWAWKSGKFRSIETFEAVMSSWNTGGKVYGILYIAVMVFIVFVYTILLGVFALSL